MVGVNDGVLLCGHDRLPLSLNVSRLAAPLDRRHFALPTAVRFSPLRKSQLLLGPMSERMLISKRRVVRGLSHAFFAEFNPAIERSKKPQKKAVYNS